MYILHVIIILFTSKFLLKPVVYEAHKCVWYKICGREHGSTYQPCGHLH